MQYPWVGGLLKGPTLVFFSLVLVACTNDSDNDSSKALRNGAALDVAGSVGDGPVVDADVIVSDADGNIIVNAVSDSNANYVVTVPEDTEFPLTITAVGGTDLVTGRAVDFTLRSVVVDPNRNQVNISPLTTLASEMASCAAGGLNGTSLANAADLLASEFSMGLDVNQVSDPMHDVVDQTNAALIVLANEALGEVIRRVHAALQGTDAASDIDTLVSNLACDLLDGAIEGAGGASSARVAAAFHAANAAVLLEVAAGQLRVDGADATSLMDQAVGAILPGVGSPPSVSNVPVTAALIEQARTSLAVVQRVSMDEDLQTLLVLLDETPLAQANVVLRQALSDGNLATLDALPQLMALEDEATLSELADAARAAGSAAAPVLSFAATPEDVVEGGTSRLSWSSANADACVANGDWSGSQPLDGTHLTEALLEPASFTLSCSGLGGTASVTVDVAVNGAPPPSEPAVSLSASTSTVINGAAVDLSWSSSDAASCAASGGWSGARDTSGTETSNALAATTQFVLTCSGPGGDDSASVTVTVQQPPPPDAPQVNLSATPNSIVAGESAQLSWAASNADSCAASGGWSGDRATSDSASTGALSATTQYSLTCAGPGGQATDSVTVLVEEQPTPEPSVNISASPPGVGSNETTTLSWSGADVSSCTASGGWAGGKDISGSEVVGPISVDTTYTLDCSGAAGNAVAMVTVSLRTARLSWDAPTQNVDGTTLTDLSGFTVHYGSDSRNYSHTMSIGDPSQTSATLTLAPGTWFFAVTASDGDENSSGFSNEVSKTVN